MIQGLMKLGFALVAYPARGVHWLGLSIQSLWEDDVKDISKRLDQSAVWRFFYDKQKGIRYRSVAQVDVFEHHYPKSYMFLDLLVQIVFVYFPICMATAGIGLLPAVGLNVISAFGLGGVVSAWSTAAIGLLSAALLAGITKILTLIPEAIKKTFELRGSRQDFGHRRSQRIADFIERHSTFFRLVLPAFVMIGLMFPVVPQSLAFIFGPQFAGFMAAQPLIVPIVLVPILMIVTGSALYFGIQALRRWWNPQLVKESELGAAIKAEAGADEAMKFTLDQLSSPDSPKANSVSEAVFTQQWHRTQCMLDPGAAAATVPLSRRSGS